ALAAAGGLSVPGSGPGWLRRRSWPAWAAGLGVLAVFLAGDAYRWASSRVLYRGRNFFGVLEVFATASDEVHVMAHGSTVHGAQYRGAPRTAWRTPRGYHHPASPAGELFGHLAARGDNRPVGVVGLGAGVLAAYGQPGQEFVFF